MVARQAHALKVEVRFLSPSIYGYSQVGKAVFFDDMYRGSSPSTMKLYNGLDVVQLVEQ